MSSDAIEVLSVSFMLPSAQCDLHLTSSDKGWLNAIIFGGKKFDVKFFNFKSNTCSLIHHNIYDNKKGLLVY